jgi:hypothetical protein
MVKAEVQQLLQSSFMRAQSDATRIVDIANGAPGSEIAERAGLGNGGYSLADMRIVTPGTDRLHPIAIGESKPAQSETTQTIPDVSAQEFVDGMSPLRKLYETSVGETVNPDPNTSRTARFHDRMGNLAIQDPQTFRDLAQLGNELAKTPSLPPEQIGKSIADILHRSLSLRGAYGEIHADSNDTQILLGALAGVMIAARSGFDPEKLPAETAAMVDGMEKELAANKTPVIHAVVYGDTGEPGLVASAQAPSDDQRHNFMN